MYNDKSKHICQRHNTIKHLLSSKITLIDYVKLRKNIVDLPTKYLLRELVYNSLMRMSLKTLKMKKVLN